VGSGGDGLGLGLGGVELGVEIGFEGVEARGDGFGGWKFGGDGVGGFEAVAGDAEDGGFVGADAALLDEFLGDAGGDAAGGFGEDAFGFGEKFDGVDDFGIGDVFGPAAGFADQLESEGAVGGIADGERAGDGVGLLRFEAREIAFDGVGDGRAAGSLRAEEFYWLGSDPAEKYEFVERFGDFADERSAGHGNDHVIGKSPAELFGDFVAVRFGAFGVVGAEVDVNEAPLEAVGDLRAEAIDVVVVAVDADDAGAVDGSVEDFSGFEIGGNEHAGVETLLRGLRSDGVGEVAGGGAADGGEAEAASGDEGGADDAVLEGERGEADGVVFHVEILDAETGSEFRGSDKRRPAGGVGRLEAVGDGEKLGVAPHIEGSAGKIVAAGFFLEGVVVVGDFERGEAVFAERFGGVAPGFAAEFAAKLEKVGHELHDLLGYVLRHLVPIRARRCTWQDSGTMGV